MTDESPKVMADDKIVETMLEMFKSNGIELEAVNLNEQVGRLFMAHQQLQQQLQAAQEQLQASKVAVQALTRMMG